MNLKNDVFQENLTKALKTSTMSSIWKMKPETYWELEITGLSLLSSDSFEEALY